MKIRTLLIGAALAALAMPALAQDKNFTLKLSHWVPATHPLQKAMEEWGASVEKASERHHQVERLSGPAARQGARTTTT